MIRTKCWLLFLTNCMLLQALPTWAVDSIEFEGRQYTVAPHGEYLIVFRADVSLEPNRRDQPECSKISLALDRWSETLKDCDPTHAQSARCAMARRYVNRARTDWPVVWTALEWNISETETRSALIQKIRDRFDVPSERILLDTDIQESEWSPEITFADGALSKRLLAFGFEMSESEISEFNQGATSSWSSKDLALACDLTTGKAEIRFEGKTVVRALRLLGLNFSSQDAFSIIQKVQQRDLAQFTESLIERAAVIGANLASAMTENSIEINHENVLALLRMAYSGNLTPNAYSTKEELVQAHFEPAVTVNTTWFGRVAQ